jgi:anti-sigma B factor antagonist
VVSSRSRPGAAEAEVQHFHLDSVSAGDGCAVLRAAGEIDVYTAPQLREKLIELVDVGSLYLIGDLRGVEFLDSTGLGALVGGLKRLRTREGSLHLVMSSERIIRIFRITGLAKVFSIHPTVPEAITADSHWRHTLAAGGHDIERWCRDHGLQ